MIVPFFTKDAATFWDPVTGFPALHEDAIELLRFVSDYSLEKGLPRPVVLCFGRLRATQAQRYMPAMMAKVKDVLGSNGKATAAARRMAVNKWDWHCVDADTKKSRAFDLVRQHYTKRQITLLLQAVLGRFPLCEAVERDDHLHFAATCAKRPQRWL